MSLRDLIYGNQVDAEASENNDEPSPRLPSTEQATPKRITSTRQSQTQQSTFDLSQRSSPFSSRLNAARIDRLYASTYAPPMTISSSSAWNLEEYSPPRKKEPKIYYERCGRPGRFSKHASAEQIEVRKRKAELKDEYRELRKRVKKRTYHVRDEEDVGGVIEGLVRQQYRTKRKEPATTDDAGYDTSEDEQDAVLKRLLASQQEFNHMTGIEKPEVDLRSWSERLDVYEKGLISVPKSALAVDYNDYQATRNIPRKSLVHIEPEEATTVTVRRLNAASYRPPAGVWTELAVSARNDLGSVNHVQKQYLWSSICRYLRAAAGDNDVSTQDRLLRLLWSAGTVIPQAYRTHHACMVQGSMMEAFLKYSFADPGLVAREMTLTPAPPGTLPFHGRERGRLHLDPNQLPASFYRILQTQDATSIPWSYLDEDDEATAAKALAPTVSFAFVPASAPPTPRFPLNPYGVVFGPSDRFLNNKYDPKPDEQLVRLTLTTLLGRLASCASTEQRQKVTRQIDALFQDAIDGNRVDSHIWLQQFTSSSVKSRPLYGLYQVLMQYTSYLVNGYQILRPNQTIDWSECVASVLESLRPTVSHAGVKMFPRLHLSHALVDLSQHLPNSAAAILGKCLDEDRCRTPFDVVRAMLEHLEENELLSTSSRPEPWQVHVGTLEYRMHQTMKVLSACVSTDLTDVVLHAWHLAMQAGCMLLCSGNRIDGAARRHPSFSAKVDQRFLDTFGDHKEADMQHEVRPSLPKFHDLRQQIASSLSMLTHLCKRQDSCRSNLLVASFLEWRQVVGLLFGSCSDADDRLKAARRLHAHHAMKWVLNDSSRVAKRYEKFTGSDREERVDVFAHRLEQEPTVVENWSRLATELGTALRWAPEKKDERCPCKSCRLIDPDYELMHGQIWASKRTSWWDDCVLNLRDKPMQYHWKGGDLAEWAKNSPDCAVQSQLPVPALLANATKLASELVVSPRSIHQRSSTDGPRPAAHGPSVLDDIEKPESTEVPPASERSERIDSLLPEPVHGVLHDSADPVAPSHFSSSSSSDLMVYRLLIAYHMYGVEHPGVLFLACQVLLVSVLPNPSRKELTARGKQYLTWLKERGVDLGAILSLFPSSPPKPSESNQDDGNSNAIKVGLRNSRPLKKMKEYEEGLRLPVMEEAARLWNEGAFDAPPGAPAVAFRLAPQHRKERFKITIGIFPKGPALDGLREFARKANERVREKLENPEFTGELVPTKRPRPSKPRWMEKCITEVSVPKRARVLSPVAPLPPASLPQPVPPPREESPLAFYSTDSDDESEVDPVMVAV